MKLRSPKDRLSLKINRNAKVLDVGGGQNPHPRANIVIDKFTDDNFHRSGNLKVLKGQEFVYADGENLPFKDKEFDYVICCHVLEHVDDPTKFLSELFRVGKKGYIETPSLIGEVLASRISHKWILHEVNDKLYIIEKSKINFTVGYYLGWLFENYLPKNSIGYKIMTRTHPNLLTIRIEWDNNFEFEVEPTDPEIRKYFVEEWKEEWASNFFQKRSLVGEVFASLKAFVDIAISVFKSKIIKPTNNKL